MSGQKSYYLYSNVSPPPFFLTQADDTSHDPWATAIKTFRVRRGLPAITWLVEEETRSSIKNPPSLRTTDRTISCSLKEIDMAPWKIYKIYHRMAVKCRAQHWLKFRTQNACLSSQSIASAVKRKKKAKVRTFQIHSHLFTSLNYFIQLLHATSKNGKGPLSLSLETKIFAYCGESLSQTSDGVPY